MYVLSALATLLDYSHLPLRLGSSTPETLFGRAVGLHMLVRCARLMQPPAVAPPAPFQPTPSPQLPSHQHPSRPHARGMCPPPLPRVPCEALRPRGARSRIPVSPSASRHVARARVSRRPALVRRCRCRRTAARLTRRSNPATIRWFAPPAIPNFTRLVLGRLCSLCCPRARS